jgi:hypothetical protein
VLTSCVELFVKYFRTAMKWLGIFVVWNIVGLPIACLFALQPMAIGLRDGPIAMLAIGNAAAFRDQLLGTWETRPDGPSPTTGGKS